MNEGDAGCWDPAIRNRITTLRSRPCRTPGSAGRSTGGCRTPYWKKDGCGAETRRKEIGRVVGRSLPAAAGLTGECRQAEVEAGVCGSVKECGGSVVPQLLSCLWLKVLRCRELSGRSGEKREWRGVCGRGRGTTAARPHARTQTQGTRSEEQQ